MYHPFAKQRRICFWTAVAFFAVIFPYTMFGDVDIAALHMGFCVLLNLLSSVLFGWLLYKQLTKNFPAEEYSGYAWLLGILAFCHGVFAGMNRGAWACIGITAVIYAMMPVGLRKERKRVEETENDEL